jgi:hypothetical protein
MTTKKRRRTRRTRIGNDRRTFGLLSVLLLLIAGPAWSQKSGTRRQAASYAVIAGTVFRESGFALPAAEVSLDPDPEATSGGKLKKMRMIANSRGEFAFRVPPGPARYVLTVKAKGFMPEKRPIAVQGEERIDESIRLVPAS